MFTHFLTDTAELRLLQEYDAAALYALVDANRDHLRPWLPWVDSSGSPTDSRAFIRDSLMGLAEGSALTMGIWSEGSMAGVIGFNHINTHHRWAAIGYWLGASFQGRGLMTTATRALVTHGFERLNLHRVEIRCAPANTRSRAIPERLGFVEEGTLREIERHPGRYEDLVIYAMLDREYAETVGW